jgi:uncharacterized protein (DUF58 family)
MQNPQQNSNASFSAASRASRLSSQRIATSLASRLRKRTRAWARRRHGVDLDPFVIPTRRVYILPTRLGLFYAGMLFLMFLGSMNYANNLSLGLTFVLASVGLVAMHHCQRNLAGVGVGSAATEPVFAGQIAEFSVAIESEAKVARHEITVAGDYSASAPVSVDPHGRAVVPVSVPAPRRGRLHIDHLQVSSNYPFGLFRAWTHVHIPMSCIVYPKPADRTDPPPPMETDTGGAQDSRRGDEDFAGLRMFQSGDSPRRIAWKAYARGQELQVKQYAGTAVTSHLLNWDSLPGMSVEARLSRLARWIEDAHTAGHAYGLRMPGVDIPPNIGSAHRQRCLTALALFGDGNAGDATL